MYHHKILCFSFKFMYFCSEIRILVMDLFKKILLIIVSPTIGWEKINKLSIPPKILQSSVFFPTLAVLSLSVFVRLFYDDSLTLAHTLVNSIIAFASYFFAVYICSIAINFYSPSSDQNSKDRLDNLIVFALEYLVILQIIGNLLPSNFAVLDFMSLYVAFIVYRGLEYINYTEKPLVFVSISTALLIFVPIVLTKIMGVILPTTV